MKRIYENFEEIAEDFCDGELLAHQLSDHSTEVCGIWQTSIREFARALDGSGMVLIQDEQVYEKFWDNIEKCFVEWKTGLNRRQSYRKKLGEISLDEARQRYNFKGEVGEKIIIPIYSMGEIGEDYYVVV